MKKKLQGIAIAMSIHICRGIIITCLLASVLLANDGNAQHKSIKEVFISLDLDKAILKESLETIEAKTGFQFIYSGITESFIKDTQVTMKVDNKSVAFVLKKIAEQTRLMFQQNDGMIGVGMPRVKNLAPNTTGEELFPEQIITGKVTDQSGEPLPGASVLVKDTRIGVVTDADGNYRLSAPDEATTLIFSFVGYERQEIAIGGRSVIDVTLTPNVTTLGEVVVSTGYWQTAERLNPGNIAKVSAKEIEAQPVTTPLQALSGRVPGVVIRQASGVPGAGIDIQIRGQNSLREDGNDPLYIVDGVPYPSTSLLSRAVSSGLFRGASVAPVNNINPSDIESIEILKDADATAIYGSRGANGVVLITTKKGKAGKTSIDINHYSGIGEVRNKVDLLNAEQYREMAFENFKNGGFDPIPEFFKPFLPDLFAWDSTRNTDWQKVLIGGTAKYHNTQFSVSGGSANTQFLFSGTYWRQTSVYPGDFALQRGSGHFNLNHQSTDKKFTTNLSLSYVAEKNELPRLDLTSKVGTLAPHAPEVFDEEGNLNFENNTFNANPFTELLKMYEGNTRNLVANMTLGYEIIPDFILKANLGYNNINLNENNINPIKANNPVLNPTGFAAFADGKSETWVIEPQIEYQKKIENGKLTLLFGSTFQSTIDDGNTIFASGYTNDALLGNVNAAPDVTVRDTRFSEYRYNAIFGRINYNWKDKFILNLTGRRDGSSRFGSGRQFGNFGAVGAAWILSEENFLKNTLSFLNFGKLRISYGTTGSDLIGDYEFLDTHSSTDLTYLGTVGLVPRRLANPDFGWETNKKIEGGIELGFINDRIVLITSYYRNRSANQLIGIPLASTTGFGSLQANFPATVENRGWEFELNTTNISTNDFQWTSGLNFTIPRNELIEFSNIENSTFANTYTVGESLFDTKKFIYTGIDAETGLYSFEDLNDDGKISFPEDIQSAEGIAVEYFGGLQNKISYRGIDLSFFFQFVKQTGANYLSSFNQPGGGQSNFPVEVMSRWQQPGDITNIQKFSNTESEGIQAHNNSLNSTFQISDASFIRLQNVVLSYNFPDVITKTLKVQKLRVYVQGQNLLTITDYLGLDPETQSSQILPPLRVLTAGVNINL